MTYNWLQSSIFPVSSDWHVFLGVMFNWNIVCPTKRFALRFKLKVLSYCRIFIFIKMTYTSGTVFNIFLFTPLFVVKRYIKTADFVKFRECLFAEILKFLSFYVMNCWYEKILLLVLILNFLRYNFDTYKVFLKEW